MKFDRPSTTGTAVTLQDVLDRLGEIDGLSEARRRDLRSAVRCYAKLLGIPPSVIPLDLATIRKNLDKMVPAQAKISAKRWANRRSDLAAALAACGLMPMLKTARVRLEPAWASLLDQATDRAVQHGLSRFARWATLRRVAPAMVEASTIERFVSELEAASLARHVEGQYRGVATAWNALVAAVRGEGLRPIAPPALSRAPVRLPWEQLPAAFRDDVERYLAWCSVPDPLDLKARGRALAPLTRRLRRNHIHSAVQAAKEAGIDIERFTALADLVDPETFRSLLRQCWVADGRKLTAYTHGLAGTLIAVAAEWVRAPAATIAALKALRRKLGTLASGLTEKNKGLVRKFDDSRLTSALLNLPDRLWRQARRGLATSRRAFIDLQTALAIDILLHVPLRMANLAALTFDEHLHWSQGPRKPALIVFRADETKNGVQLEHELPEVLAERIRVYRTVIAPAVTGSVPGRLFVSPAAKPRTQSAVTLAIEKAILRHLGVEITPHQFRHLAAKLTLDQSPGAHELVRQKLAHRNMKTTTNFYAGIDTRRASRAHAALLLQLRNESGHRPSRRSRHKNED